MEVFAVIISLAFLVMSIIFYVKIWQAASHIIEDSDRAAIDRRDGSTISRLYITGETEEARMRFKDALSKLFAQIVEKYDEETAEKRIDKQIELYQDELSLLGLTLPPHMESGKAFMEAYRAMADIRKCL